MGARHRGCGLEEEGQTVVVGAMLWSIASRVAGCRYGGALQTRIGAQPLPPAGTLAVGLVAWPADWLYLVETCSHVRGCVSSTWAAQGGMRRLRWCLLMLEVSEQSAPGKFACDDTW